MGEALETERLAGDLAFEIQLQSTAARYGGTADGSQAGTGFQWHQHPACVGTHEAHPLPVDVEQIALGSVRFFQDLVVLLGRELQVWALEVLIVSVVKIRKVPTGYRGELG